MNNDADKLPKAVWGLLIFMACVLIALIVYWTIAVMDIMEQRRLAEGAVSGLSQIYHIAKFSLT